MKTRAFLIRVVICFLLSLIPLTEFENRIYSARLDFRSRWSERSSVTIVDLDGGDADVAPRARMLREQALEHGARTALILDPAKVRSLAPDPDGVIRKAYLQTKAGTSLAYQAFLETSRAYRNRNVLHPEHAHLINFLGGPGRVPRCAPTKCLADPDTFFRGRIVLVSEDSDPPTELRTPLGDMSLAEVVANDIDTIAARRPIYRASYLATAFMILAMILLSAFYLMYYPVMISALAVAGTGVFVVVGLFQGVFELFGVYIPSANIGDCFLITYLTFTGYRLARQENLQWRAHKQAQYSRELDQLKSNFLSLVSHDLKTPIAKIQAVNERLRRESQRLAPGEWPELREMLDSIENSNNELKHTITSLLNLSKIESQKVVLNRKSNDINRLISQALKRLRPLAQQKNIGIEESLDPLFSVECDEDLIRQVLSNLIDNAVKYSPAGSRVIVRSREEDGFIRVEVEDFGPGIPQDQLPMMFRKFSRLRNRSREQVKGTGLGLYLSKYFIELHGGKIQVRSIAGKSTTFAFMLPLATGTAPGNAIDAGLTVARGTRTGLEAAR